MSHKFQCQVCSLELTVSDKLFAERIDGKSVSVRCKRCKAMLTVVGEGQKVKLLGTASTADASLAPDLGNPIEASPATPGHSRTEGVPAPAQANAIGASPATPGHSRTEGVPAPAQANSTEASPANRLGKELASQNRSSPTRKPQASNGDLRSSPHPANRTASSSQHNASPSPPTQPVLAQTRTTPAQPNHPAAGLTRTPVTKPGGGLTPVSLTHSSKREPEKAAAQNGVTDPVAATSDTTRARPTQVPRPANSAKPGQPVGVAAILRRPSPESGTARPNPPVSAMRFDEIEEVSVATLLPTDPPAPEMREEVSVSTLLRSDPPSKVSPEVVTVPSAPLSNPEAVAPMPILSLDNESTPSPATVEPAQVAPGPVVVQNATNAEQSSPNRVSGNRASDFGDSEPELTPPAATVALDSHPQAPLQQAAVAEMSVSLTGERGLRRPTLRKSLSQYGAAAVVLAAASLLGLGLVRGRSSKQTESRAGTPSAALRPVESKPIAALSVAHVAVAPTTLPVESKPIAAPSVAHVAVAPTTLPVAAEPAEPPALPVKSANLVDAPASRERQDGSAAGDDAIPDYVFKPAVIHLTGQAIHRAERCHPMGHAVGTARVFFTFSPNGRVTDARVEGEPLSSAPVARCILDHARAIQMKKFEGAPFTVSLPITLR